MIVVQVLVNAFFAYLGIGLILYLFLFISGRFESIDPATKGATLGFRLLMAPGICALWPWILSRILKHKAQ